MKDKYKNMMFLEADTGGGDGGAGDGAGAGTGDGVMTRGEAAFDPVTKSTTGDRPLPGEKKASPGPTGTQTTTEEPVVKTESTSFDPSKFAKEFADSLGTSLKPIIESRTEAKPQMTAEEARKMLKVWEPDDNWYKAYDNLETRKDAVSQMRDALVQQADTLAQMRMQQMLEAFKGEISPQLDNIKQFQDQQRDQRFSTQFPQLSKPELQPLVRAVTEDLVKQGKKFNSESEAFKALASGVEAVIKVNNPDFKLETATTNGNGTQTADRGGRQLPVTTPGGGGGTGRREGGNQPETKRGLAIFGK